MNKIRPENKRFIYTYENGSTGSVEGPGITADNIVRYADYRSKFYKIVKVEECSSNDIIRCEINNYKKQIDYFNQQIKELEAELV